MALRIWLPLNGSLENKGISDIVPSGTPSFKNGGKTGSQCLSCADMISVSVPSMALSKIWSVCFWGYVISSSISDYWTLISRLNDGKSNLRIEVCPSNYSNGIYCYLIVNNGAYNITNGNITSPNGGYYDKWTHFCLTSNGKTITRYINGAPMGTCSYTGTGAITGTFVLANNDKINKNDFRIYDHCLSAKEVKEISQGLVLHYKLDGWSGGAGENLLIHGGKYTKDNKLHHTMNSIDGVTVTD